MYMLIKLLSRSIFNLDVDGRNVHVQSVTLLKRILSFRLTKKLAVSFYQLYWNFK